MHSEPRQASDGPLVLADAVSWHSPTGTPVLESVTLALSKEKTGLVGSNGCGKTTLARLLTGEIAPTQGAVRRIGEAAFLPQDFAPLAEHTVASALGVEDKLAALERLALGSGLPGDLEAIDEDWAVEARIAAALDRLGLAHLTLDRQMATLSGGEITRVALAALFLQCPDLIILDEPTNNLDRDSRQALYKAIADWPGGLLVVSHDRELLGLMDRIIELSPHGLRSYGGNYELYREQRDAEAAAAQRDVEHAARELRKTKRVAQAARERQQRRSSRGKKTRDKVGMGKIELNTRRDYSEKTTARLSETANDRIDNARQSLETAIIRATENAELNITLTPVEIPAGKIVLELEAVGFGYDNSAAPLLNNVNLQMIGPERVAVTGPNGSGKTTLLKLIMGELQPSAGRIRVGAARVSYLDQTASLLVPEYSVVENFRAWNPSLTETVCRLTLARFLFKADAVHQQTATLSGGERLRAALACVLMAVDPPHLILLDEPTNHLDLASLENLEQALCMYTGALLVISHDDAFLKNIDVCKILELG